VTKELYHAINQSDTAALSECRSVAVSFV